MFDPFYVPYGITKYMYLERIYNAPSGIISAIGGKGMCTNYRDINKRNTSGLKKRNASAVPRNLYVRVIKSTKYVLFDVTTY